MATKPLAKRTRCQLVLPPPKVPNGTCIGLFYQAIYSSHLSRSLSLDGVVCISTTADESWHRELIDKQLISARIKGAVSKHDATNSAIIPIGAVCL